MTLFLYTVVWSVGAILLGAFILHLLPKLGELGRDLASFFTKAPGLDLVVTWFTILPPVVGLIALGWRGLLGGIVGQIIGLIIWCWLHELAHLRAARGPRIVKVLNKLVGRPRNHAALWVTTLAVPVFWIIRLAELIAYPPLIWLVRFPRYKQNEWVCVSRQKYKGLIGHDLIWCLYCDWMTGVWSLGSEMLRNVESFWCPIRFSSTNKCDNCQNDFPDIWNAWVPPDGSMKDVTDLLEQKYGQTPDDPNAPARYCWFGHPDRAEPKPVDLTVEGQEQSNE